MTEPTGPARRVRRTSLGRVDADLRRGIPPAGPWARAARIILAPFWGWCVRPVWRGVGNVPTVGPVIIATNHVTAVDPLMVTQAVAYGAGRIPHFLAKASLFAPPGTGWIMRGALQIPVHRESDDPAAALRDAAAALARGYVVVIYPEGTRTKDPDLWPMVARTGVARLAQQSGAPVVPMAHWGTQEFHRGTQEFHRGTQEFHRGTQEFHGGGRFRFRRAVRVTSSFGPPLDLTPFDDLPEAERLHAVTGHVMAAVTTLLVGIRGGTPPAVPLDPRAPKDLPLSPGGEPGRTGPAAA